MNTKPILFSGDMVRAILDGRKTQTRRVVKHKNDFIMEEGMKWPVFESYVYGEDDIDVPCPYKADLLWVRETWAVVDVPAQACVDIYYPNGRASGIEDRYIIDGVAVNKYLDGGLNDKNRPSIHMPREFSRITLNVTNIRVERLQDISEGDARAEGVEFPDADETLTNRDLFWCLWDSINGKRGCGWDVNPWVWVVEFEPIFMNVDEVLNTHGVEA